MSRTVEQDMRTSDVLDEVHMERINQDDARGEQNLPDGTGPASQFMGVPVDKVRELMQNVVNLAEQAGQSSWLPVLLEEVFEAAAEADVPALRAELVQVAAVAVAWVEALDRRTGHEGGIW